MAGERPCAARGSLTSCQHFIEHMVGVVHVELEAEIGFDAATGPPDLKAGSRAVGECPG